MVRNRAKIVPKIVLAALLASLLLVIAGPFFVVGRCQASASGRCVLEQNTLRVLEEENAHMRLPMASTTKTMTAYLAVTQADLDEQVVIPAQAVGVEGSSIYLKCGEVWTLRDLVYGLMLRSGNDAAVAIACHVGGSVARFVARMNEQAEEWGLRDTNFENPHGLHHANHYTSAYDLAVIGARAMRHPIFKQIVSTQSIRVQGDLNGAEGRYFTNKNKILTTFEGGNGIKTGYTKAAGRCLLSASERNGMQVVCAVLNVPDMFGVSAQMMERAHQSYRMQALGAAGDGRVGTVSVQTRRGPVEVPVTVLGQAQFPVKSDQSECVHVDIKAPKGLSGPLQKGEIVGEIVVTVENRLIFSKKIYTMLEVER